MSTLLAGAVVATAMLSNCSWNSPGRNPYRGSVSEAVSRYVDIPAPVRSELIAKIQSGRADDLAIIMRDSVAGKFDYSPHLTSMHFGQRTVCEYVTRDNWAPTRREPASVYCSGEHCLIVPKICGNISRVRRIVGGGGGTGASAPAPGAVALPRPAEPGMVKSPEDVAAADAIAETIGSVGPFAETAAFSSPFSGARHAPELDVPAPGSELTQPAPVPEPATLGMLGAGLAVVFGAAWRARRRAM